MGKMTSAKASRRNRINFTVRQLDTMEKVFIQTQYPDVLVIDKLSTGLDIPVEKILTWFQNRRSKFRKSSQKGHIQWMRAQLFSGDSPSSGEKPPTSGGHCPTPTVPQCHVLTKSSEPKNSTADNSPSNMSMTPSISRPGTLQHSQTNLGASVQKCYQSGSHLQSVSMATTPMRQTYPPSLASYGYPLTQTYPHSSYWQPPYISLPTMHRSVDFMSSGMSSASASYQPISSLDSSPPQSAPVSQPISSISTFPSQTAGEFQPNLNMGSPAYSGDVQTSRSLPSSPTQVAGNQRTCNVSPASAIQQQLSCVAAGMPSTAETSPAGHIPPVAQPISNLFTSPVAVPVRNLSTSSPDSSSSEYHQLNGSTLTPENSTSMYQPTNSLQSPSPSSSGSPPPNNQSQSYPQTQDIVDLPADFLSSIMSLPETRDYLESCSNFAGWTQQQSERVYGYPPNSYNYTTQSDVTVGQTPTPGMHHVDYPNHGYTQQYNHINF